MHQSFCFPNHCPSPTPPGVDYQTVQPNEELGALGTLGRNTAMLLTDLTQGASSWFQSLLDPVSLSLSSSPRSTPQQDRRKAGSCDMEQSNGVGMGDYPEGFVPLRSEQLSEVHTPCAPILKNPYVSPLLAPSNLLKGLPPLHIVVRETGGIGRSR